MLTSNRLRILKNGSKPCVFDTFDLNVCFAPQRRALFDPRKHIRTSKSGPYPRCFATFYFEMCFAPQRRALFSTSQRPKVVRTRRVLPLLTSKCATRHNGVHFFHISTSKSGPSMVCFVHFYFQMCFAPQRRALFQHLNFQKCSEHGVFCHF